MGDYGKCTSWGRSHQRNYLHFNYKCHTCECLPTHKCWSEFVLFFVSHFLFAADFTENFIIMQSETVLSSLRKYLLLSVHKMISRNLVSVDPQSTLLLNQNVTSFGQTQFDLLSPNFPCDTPQEEFRTTCTFRYFRTSRHLSTFVVFIHTQTIQGTNLPLETIMKNATGKTHEYN